MEFFSYMDHFSRNKRGPYIRNWVCILILGRGIKGFPTGKGYIKVPSGEKYLDLNPAMWHPVQELMAVPRTLRP